MPLQGGLSRSPTPPSGLLKATERDWEVFWGSEVARITAEVDLPAVRRLFTYYDEWARALREFRKQRFVEGSKKQPRLNPMGDQMAKLEGLIRGLEGELGLTPYRRSKLLEGIAGAQRSLEEMNRSVDADEDEAQTEDDDPRTSVDVASSDR